MGHALRPRADPLCRQQLGRRNPPTRNYVAASKPASGNWMQTRMATSTCPNLHPGLAGTRNLAPASLAGVTGGSIVGGVRITGRARCDSGCEMADTPHRGHAMNLDLVPIWVVFIGTVLLVMVFIEVGYRLGGIAHCKSVDEIETPVSGVSADGAGPDRIILAFSFSIVDPAIRHPQDAGARRSRRGYVRPICAPTSFQDRIAPRAGGMPTAYVQERLHITRGTYVRQEELGRALASSRVDPSSPVGHRGRERRARHEFGRRRALH